MQNTAPPRGQDRIRLSLQSQKDSRVLRSSIIIQERQTRRSFSTPHSNRLLRTTPPTFETTVFSRSLCNRLQDTTQTSRWSSAETDAKAKPLADYSTKAQDRGPIKVCQGDELKRPLTTAGYICDHQILFQQHLSTFSISPSTRLHTLGHQSAIL